MSLVKIAPQLPDDSVERCALCRVHASDSSYYVSCGGESTWTEKTTSWSGIQLTEFREKDQVVLWRLTLCRQCLVKAISGKKLKDSNKVLDLAKSCILYGGGLSALFGFPLYYLHTHIVFGMGAAFARKLLPFPLTITVIMACAGLILLPPATFLLHRAKAYEKRMNLWLEMGTVPESAAPVFQKWDESSAILDTAQQILSRLVKNAGQLDLFVPLFPLPEPRQTPERSLKHPSRTYVRVRFEQKVLATGKTQEEAIPAAWKRCPIIKKE